MDAPDALQSTLRLAAATFLAALIGLEREYRGGPAGLRTHILVANGACLLAMLSGAVATGAGGDAARLSAAVITGIGFLGAGAIIRHGRSVQGLTTAASIWVVAAMGIACGAGWFVGAGIAGAFALVSLLTLRRLELHWSKQTVRVTIHTCPYPEEPAILDNLLLQYGAEPDETERTTLAEDGTVRITTVIRGRKQAKALLADLRDMEFVTSVMTVPPVI